MKTNINSSARKKGFRRLVCEGNPRLEYFSPEGIEEKLTPIATRFFSKPAKSIVSKFYCFSFCFLLFLCFAFSASGQKAGTVKGNDGKVYKTVKIGNQLWMAENLRETKYTDGSEVVNWSKADATAQLYIVFDYEFLFEDPLGVLFEPEHYKGGAASYGYLYTWYAVSPKSNPSKNLCPVGWHVPSSNDWFELENYLIANGYNYDGTTTGNKIAKSLASGSKWNLSNEAGTPGSKTHPQKINEAGFSALPGGDYDAGWTFAGIGYRGIWWSSTEHDQTDAYIRALFADQTYFLNAYDDKKSAFSVRCLKN